MNKLSYLYIFSLLLLLGCNSQTNDKGNSQTNDKVGYLTKINYPTNGFDKDSLNRLISDDRTDELTEMYQDTKMHPIGYVQLSEEERREHKERFCFISGLMSVSQINSWLDYESLKQSVNDKKNDIQINELLRDIEKGQKEIIETLDILSKVSDPEFNEDRHGVGVPCEEKYIIWNNYLTESDLSTLKEKLKF